MSDTQQILILIPTYNEIDNVELIISRIRAVGINASILFVDDNSPDGTGKLLENLSRQDPQLHILHRSGKLGVGSAHIDGIYWAYDHGFQTLVTMDSDQTHSPEDILEFVNGLADADVVVGSRFKDKDSLPGWSIYRKIMTFAGHFLTVSLLKMPFDATGAFRAYNLENIPRGIFEMVESTGYSFFYESLHRLHKNKIPISEFSIHLPSRTYGHSKMRLSDMVGGLTYLISLAIQSRISPTMLIFAKPFLDPKELETSEVKIEWNAYWSSRSHSGKWLYNLIAAFYRQFIIRPAVNHFLRKSFKENASLLHAGSGTGMVDTDMAKIMKITALDISPAALTEYRRNHVGHENFILGSVFNIPVEANTYDGIFNLGVMEHFHEDELEKIFVEFNRVLKPGGSMVLFWPPAWGLTVNVLKIVHFILNRLLGKNIKLHPDEHTHIHSQIQTAEWMDEANFEMKTFYFGIRDLFTHQIIIAEKRSDPTA